MRRAFSLILALVASLLLSVGLAACGGQKISADEVSAPPPELTVPTGGGEDADALAGESGGDSGDSADDPDEDEDTAAGSDEDTASSGSGDDTASGDSGAAAPSGGSTGGAASGSTPAPTATAAPAQPEDSSQSDTPAPAGSEAQEFEEFCEQNAGAC